MSHLYTLPSRFVLKRFKPDVYQKRPDLASHIHDAVLITTRRIGFENAVYETELVEDPITILGDSIVLSSTNDTWFNGNKVAFLLKHGEKILSCALAFNGCILDTIHGLIPVLKQSDPCELYGNKFTFLYTDMYQSYRFTCLPNLFLRAAENPAGGGGAQIPIAPPVQHARMPQHIVNTYITSLLDKNEACPIEMTPLTKETVRITNCGHAMSANAAEYWIACKHSCPVCRQECSLEELQGWV